MSNPLQPTQITDKNGYNKTVHKRTDSAKTSKRAVGVAPVTAAIPALEDASDSAAEMTGQDFSDLVSNIWLSTHESDWDTRERVLERYKAGFEYPYANHYDAMWEGRAVNVLGGQDGWSEQVVKDKLAGVDSIRARVESGELVAADLRKTTEFFTKEDAIGWCIVTASQLTEALETEGRSLVINARDAAQRYRDFEGGGNAR